MSFWDHLEVFRSSLFRVLGVLLVFMIIYFSILRLFFDSFVLGPTTSDFFLYRWIPYFKSDFHIDIININVASQFMTHVSTSFWFALVTAFPFVIWELWRFVSPALYTNEKRPIRFAFSFGTGMFYLGCLVGYCIVFPFTFRFLTEYELSADITNQISLNSYMGTFLMMIFVMGIVFEMPLLIWVLSRIGLVNKQMLRKYRRHAIVALLILAAIITPSGDPFTLTVVFVPLYLLFELGIVLARPAEKEEDDDEEPAPADSKPEDNPSDDTPAEPDNETPAESDNNTPAEPEPTEPQAESVPEQQDLFSGQQDLFSGQQDYSYEQDIFSTAHPSEDTSEQP